ncbi:hypothetical protein CPB86DRAFT_774534 [Serendipita vermifera]|nr:hypothetical protein CPB86DRAFT_774534 [Serendipita vermifera]
METLSRREEDALMKSTKAKALKECDDIVKAFASCAAGRTVSVVWACKDEYKAVQNCMKTYTNPQRMEELRREYKAQLG